MERYLGPIDRTGKGLLRAERADREAETFGGQPGFCGPQRIEVPGKSSRAPVIRLWPRSSRSRARLRTCSEIVGMRSKPIFASYCTETNSNDLFSEHMQEIPAEIWRR